ncbi:response regulator [Pseudolysinimonas sp.]|uniref:response regulator n=1 Tax=Pseudolysinimonas sp. TaxID=2680009 RepID=UPI00286CBD0E|nr:response regulator [Pseudolysinimonas sp.]
MSEPIRVLIVDDDEVVARLHEAFLASIEGFVVCATAGTGPDAVAAIRTTAPDIVLLDMHLPGFSGLEVLRVVRGDPGRRFEVIAVTAARDVDTVREARRAGVRHYLAKPFSSDDLRRRLVDLRDESAVARTPALAQAQIDDVMASRNWTGTLPKGLSPETLEAIRVALGEVPDASAAQLGDHVGLSRVSARRYLEHLVNGGAATRALDYASAGRPTTRYRLTS